MKKRIIIVSIIVSVIMAILHFFYLQNKYSIPQKEVHFSGKLNVDAYNYLADNLVKYDELILKSSGGSITQSIKIVQMLNDRKIKVILDDYCLSACAEVLLPSLERMKFSHNIVIGFHGNSILKNRLYREHDDKKRVECYGKNASFLKTVWKNKGAVSSLWNEQYKRFSPYDPVFKDDRSRCGSLTYKLKNKYWFPTKKDMQKFYGVKIDVKFCNDDLRCVLKKIPESWGSGNYIIGDHMHTIN